MGDLVWICFTICNLTLQVLWPNHKHLQISIQLFTPASARCETHDCGTMMCLGCAIWWTGNTVQYKSLITSNWFLLGQRKTHFWCVYFSGGSLLCFQKLCLYQHWSRASFPLLEKNQGCIFDKTSHFEMSRGVDLQEKWVRAAEMAAVWIKDIDIFTFPSIILRVWFSCNFRL